MNKNKKNKNIQVEFANAAGMLASRFSISPIVGQIYGLLYMSQDPVSLNGMVEKLGISKGSASTNVRILESWGAVRKVWVSNSRKDYYTANPDTLSIITNRIQEGLQKRLNEAKRSLKNVESKLTGKQYDGADKEDFMSERLQNIKDMYKQLTEFLDLISDKG